MMSKPTDTPTELQLGIEMLKTVFQSGDRQAIEAVMCTLDVSARMATDWAKEHAMERRAKLAAIPGGRTASKLA
jgi:hypothetical protein